MTASAADWPDPDQVPSMLRHVANGRLDDALRQHPLPDGEWCVRRLDLAVELDPDRPLSALETSWADRVVTALRRSLLDGSTDVVHFARPEAVIDDMLAGIVSRDCGHAWAWRQVGLLRPADPQPDADPLALLLVTLERLQRGTAAALVRLVAHAGVAQVHRMIGPGGWQRLATIATAESGVAWVPSAPGLAVARHPADADPRPDRAMPGSGSLETRPQVDDARPEVDDARPHVDDARPSNDSSIAQLASAVVSNGVLSTAFRDSGLRVDGVTLRSWAVLALAEADPLLLGRSARDLEDLVRFVADRLQPQSSPGFSGSARTSHVRPDGRAKTRTTTVDAALPDPPGGDGGGPSGDAGPDDEQPMHDAPATAWGGLLFLLNTATAAGLPEALQAPPFRARTAGWVLHGIGLRLLPIEADDPVLLALAGVSEVPVGDADESERRALAECAGRWAAQTADLLRACGAQFGEDAELVRRIARREAIIERESGWIEMTLRLSDVDLDVRRAGLDLDPGWVAWLGNVVRFRYE
ncbi:hypothetical protein [Microbacterium pumilum]